MTKIGQHLRILLSGFLLLGAMPTLSGCTKDMLQNAPFSTRRVNLTETSYAATDMMVQQVNAYITPTTPIEIGTLTDLAYPMAKAPLGRTIPAQVGARLVQLGYNVTSIPATMANPSAATKGAIVNGHYALMRSDIAVHLQIADRTTNKVLAAYDYTLPYTSELRMLMGFAPPPQPKKPVVSAVPSSASGTVISAPLPDAPKKKSTLF
jgi:hypothetical protein